MIITGNDLAGISDLKHFLSNHFEMKDLGSLNYLMGIKVLTSNYRISLSQVKYVIVLLFKKVIAIIN